MHSIENSSIYNIGGIWFNILIKSKLLDLAATSGSYKFLYNSEKIPECDYSLTYSIIDNIIIPENKKPAFSASSFDENQIPYEWDVYDFKDYFSIIIKIDDNSGIELVKADFDLDNKFVNIELKLKDNLERLLFDPFFQPLGPILINYIVHHKGGIMIHASGVKDDERGYVFTAVSGTGKSTMAGLWQKTGAQVINDDRLILIPKGEKVIMTNTPMPYYQDIYKESPVTAMFLIRQSPENYLKQVPGAAGVAGLMANCIQFLYNKEMVQKHLEAITAIAGKCPVYELGFKPTTEITEIIRREFGK